MELSPALTALGVGKHSINRLLLIWGAVANLRFDTNGPTLLAVAALETKVTTPKHGLRTFAHSIVEEEEETGSAEMFCSMNISGLEPYLNPPDAVQSFLSMAMGISAGWDIDKIGTFVESFGSGSGNGTSEGHVCSELAKIMDHHELDVNSTKDFILLTIGDATNSWNPSSLLMGADADAKRCSREMERTESGACDHTTAEVAEKERENPGTVSGGLRSVLPICMGLRFCNDEDIIDGSVQFGFVTEGNGGQGITFGKIGPCDVSFKGLAYDTAGQLPFTFHAPLINPMGGPAITHPRGAHFLITGAISLPLTIKVPGTEEIKSIGDVAVHTAQIGMYSELEIDGTNTSDVVKVIGHLGDIGELANQLDRLQFQLFFDAEAMISVNLGELFPLPGNFTLTLFEGALSAMLDIQIQLPEDRNERRHWYTGSAGQTCNQVCNIYNLQCTDNSLSEQSSLLFYGEAHEAFFEAGRECSAIGDAQVGAGPFESPDGCFKPTREGSDSTCDTTGGISDRLLCYCEEGEAGAVAVMESTQTKNVAQCVHESQTWMQHTYIALSVSTHISTGDVAALMSPFLAFGEFLAGLLPGVNATDPTENPVNDVEGLMLAARVYLKLPLSGSAHFIIQIDASIVINCDTIDRIKDWVGSVWEHLPGSSIIDTFCAVEDPTLSATISLGFEGLALDETNSYLEFVAGTHTHRIDFNIFPSCPPPVLTGGGCVYNSDCESSDSDPETTSCSAYQGYCLNHPTWHTSTGCLGTCIEKLPNGADCSGGILNLNPLDLDRYTGDDDVCQSGRCNSQDLTCAPKLPVDERCWEDEDCSSGRCASTLPFTCQPRNGEGQGCLEDEDCVAGGCSWALTCGRTCALDSQCSTGRCSRRLICEPLLDNGYGCGEDDDCASGRCTRSLTCDDKLANDWRCMMDNDCQSNNCDLHWSGYYCTPTNYEDTDLVWTAVE